MKILLDTTIHIDRLLGSKERKEAVSNILRDNELYSSTYVLGEYLNNIVSDCITLFALFMQERDIAETGKKISEEVFGRSQGRMNKLFYNIIEFCDRDLDLIEDYFDDFLNMLIDDFYLDIKKPLINNTECARAYSKVEKEEGIWVISKCSCTKKNNQCDICTFWKERTEDADKLQESLIDNKLIKILSKGKNSPEEYKGNNCKSLGDTIIVLESKTLKEEFGVCSSNKNDFTPICDCLNVNLMSPDYSFKK